MRPKAYLTMFGAETLIFGYQTVLANHDILAMRLYRYHTSGSSSVMCTRSLEGTKPDLFCCDAAAALVPQGMTWHLPFTNKPAKRLSFVDVIYRPGAAAQGHAKLGLMAHMGASCISY